MSDINLENQKDVNKISEEQPENLKAEPAKEKSFLNIFSIFTRNFGKAFRDLPQNPQQEEKAAENKENKDEKKEIEHPATVFTTLHR